MYRLILIAFLVMLFADPQLAVLEQFAVEREMLLALVLALITTPWVVSQFDS
jgi:hypothetical protein